MDAEIRRQRIETGIKWSLGLLGAAIISPVIFLAVKGLVGLAIAASAGLIVIRMAPVFGVWVANLQMKLLVSAVEANPIETMQNLYVEKVHELNEADNNIADFEAEVRNYDDQLDDFKNNYPAKADTYQIIGDKMKEALKSMKSGQTAARQELQAFSEKITEAKAIYKMSLAAQKVVKLSHSAEAQVFAQIKEQVAFDSVRTQLNKSFANLNLALEKRTDARALTEGHRTPSFIQQDQKALQKG